MTGRNMEIYSLINQCTYAALEILHTINIMFVIILDSLVGCLLHLVEDALQLLLLLLLHAPEHSRILFPFLEHCALIFIVNAPEELDAVAMYIYCSLELGL